METQKLHNHIAVSEERLEDEQPFNEWAQNHFDFLTNEEMEAYLKEQEAKNQDYIDQCNQENDLARGQG